MESRQVVDLVIDWNGRWKKKRNQGFILEQTEGLVAPFPEVGNSGEK